MGKCRMLIDENEELGRQLSQGRVAQLQAELALQKNANEEMQRNIDEMTGYVLQLDEEVGFITNNLFRIITLLAILSIYIYDYFFNHVKLCI